MAIQYVGGQGAGFAGKTSETSVNFALTGGLASVPAAGDMVIISYHVGGTTDKTLYIRNPSAVAYDLIGSELYQNDSYDSNLRVCYRFMPETPETSFLLSQTFSTADAGRYTVHVFRGVDTNSPLDVAAVEAGAINGRIVNPGAITPITSGAWIYVTGGAAGATGGTYTASYLTAFLAGYTVDTVDSQIGSGYYSGWSSGSYDPAAFSGGGTSTTSDSWTSLTVALRPGAAPPTPQAVDGTFTLAGGVGCNTSKQVSGTFTSAGTINRQTSKGFSGPLAFSGELATNLISAVQQAIAGVFALAGTVGLRAYKGLSGIFGETGNLTLSIPSPQGGNATFSGGMTFTFYCYNAGGLDFGGMTGIPSDGANFPHRRHINPSGHTGLGF